METIRHITEAALTEDPEKAQAEIRQAQEKLERMLDATRAELAAAEAKQLRED